MSSLELDAVQAAIIHVDVAPRTPVGELPLDLKVRHIGDLALDADAPARDIEARGVVVGERRSRIPHVADQARADVDTEEVAVAHRGAVIPPEVPVPFHDGG